MIRDYIESLKGVIVATNPSLFFFFFLNASQNHAVSFVKHNNIHLFDLLNDVNELLNTYWIHINQVEPFRFVCFHVEAPVVLKEAGGCMTTVPFQCF